MSFINFHLHHIQVACSSWKFRWKVTVFSSWRGGTATGYFVLMPFTNLIPYNFLLSHVDCKALKGPYKRALNLKGLHSAPISYKNKKPSSFEYQLYQFQILLVFNNTTTKTPSCTPKIPTKAIPEIPSSNPSSFSAATRVWQGQFNNDISWQKKNCASKTEQWWVLLHDSDAYKLNYKSGTPSNKEL